VKTPASANAPALILASSSPRRRDLLGRLGVPFEVRAPEADERPLPGEEASAGALRLARDKALMVARQWEAGHPGLRPTVRAVVGADTVVVLDRDPMGKPADAAGAASMLRRLSGRRHEVITGVFVQGVGPAWRTVARGFIARTQVEFKVLTESEIAAYVATGEPLDKAGAYAVQGGAASMVCGTYGSYTNVVGLPVEELAEILNRDFDFALSLQPPAGG